MENRSQSVFLSYSRDDLAFAIQLAYSLRACGYRVLLDHTDLHGGEAWLNRLQQLIIEADTVVFILSPSSATSETCRWEVDQAVAFAKRIIPVVCRTLGDIEPHPALSERNYVFFYPEPASPDSGFGKGLALLLEVLSKDMEWLRDHTRLTEMAVHWEKAGRSDDLLPRGSELEAFRGWRTRRPAGAPPLTALQQAYLDAGDLLERRLSDEARRQIEEMAQAQAERQRALVEAETAQAARERATRTLLRRTIAGIAAASVLGVAVLISAAAAYRYAVERDRFASEKERETQRAERALMQATAEQQLQDRMLQLARNRANPESPFRADLLARRYEGQASDQVGYDLDAGSFYGTFRIRADTTMNEFIAYLARSASTRAFYDALVQAGGSAAAAAREPRFVAAWQQLARDPATADKFSDAQLNFIKSRDYRRLRARLAGPVDRNAAAPGLGIDVCDRSLALQAVAFSIAVQYGPNSPLPLAALAGVADPVALSDRELIERLFEERDEVATYFPELSSDRYVELVKLRNEWEKQDALFILEHAGVPGRCD